MTLQQLRYLVTIVEKGSITKAAESLFVSQPALSKSIADLEKEMHIAIIGRNNRGVYLTEEGTKFLSYARQVLEQTDLLERRYKDTAPMRRSFAISAQHYAFVVNAFVELLHDYGRDKYEFSLRETHTNDIIEDVRTGRSDLGVLYESDFNRSVISSLLNKADLEFRLLFTAAPHVFISRDHPLAGKKQVTLKQLQNYPRLSFEQGINNSFYLSEEPHSMSESQKNIIVTDRATLFNLLIGLQGYTISSGILSTDLNGDNIVSVPLVSKERMDIGYIVMKERPMSNICSEYIGKLQQYIRNYHR